MDNLIRIVIVMEMLLANLVTVNNCSTRKYSRRRTLIVLLCFTYILTSFTHGLWEHMGFDQGNALFALIGIIYLIPLSLLYKENFSHISSILFSAWIYTLIVYCSSVFLARFFPALPLMNAVMLVQTVLYGATFYIFSLWTRKGLLFILHNIAKSSRYILQLVSLSWFFSIVIIHGSLIYHDSQVLDAAVVLSLITNPILSYLMLYSMVMNQKQVKNLEYIVYTDYLTGLSNRARLFKDLSLLIDDRVPFRLYFIDLNRFKQINDNYGHGTGDQYLICFSRYLTSVLDKTDQLYRMSGDEFIITSSAKHISHLQQILTSFPDRLPELDVPFLGMSVGWADYPAEAESADQLISLADKRMYRGKPSDSR